MIPSIQKITTLAILVFFISTFFACNRECPPDEKKGAIELLQSSLDWFPYIGNENLVFASSEGDTLLLAPLNGIEAQNEKLCYETICTEWEFDGPSTCKYYEAESRRLIFTKSDGSSSISEDDFLLELLLYQKVYDDEPLGFIDVMRVNFSRNISSAIGEKVVGQHFEEEIDLVQANLDFEELEPVASITLNNQTFTNVYTIKFEPFIQMFYHPQQGLVGFIAESTTWNLVN